MIFFAWIALSISVVLVPTVIKLWYSHMELQRTVEAMTKRQSPESYND